MLEHQTCLYFLWINNNSNNLNNNNNNNNVFLSDFKMTL